MAFDKDCPCNTDCPDRPNCKGCERGNAWRKKKQEERDQQYKEKAFNRYRMDKYAYYEKLNVENSKKPKKTLNKKR